MAAYGLANLLVARTARRMERSVVVLNVPQYGLDLQRAVQVTAHAAAGCWRWQRWRLYCWRRLSWA